MPSSSWEKYQILFILNHLSVMSIGRVSHKLKPNQLVFFPHDTVFFPQEDGECENIRVLEINLAINP